MDETHTNTAESFMRSLAQQLAHQTGRTVEDFKYWVNPKKESEKESKEETAAGRQCSPA